MKTLTLLFLAICVFTTFAAGQKTVRKRPKTQPFQTSNDQASINQTSPGTASESSNQFDTPVKILYQPHARYPSQQNGMTCIQGIVVLRVQFLASGEIGTISVITSLPYVTPNAIEAAKKIKFEPATKNGNPVTVSKPVKYVFSIY